MDLRNITQIPENSEGNRGTRNENIGKDTILVAKTSKNQFHRMGAKIKVDVFYEGTGRESRFNQRCSG